MEWPKQPINLFIHMTNACFLLINIINAILSHVYSKLQMDWCGTLTKSQSEKETEGIENKIFLAIDNDETQTLIGLSLLLHFYIIFFNKLFEIEPNQTSLK